MGVELSDRTVIQVEGSDGFSLLQKLASNDLSALENGQGIVYTLLLTPQGRYLYDFFVFRQEGELYIDAPLAQADGLIAKLNQYKLRADVTCAKTDIKVFFEIGGQQLFIDPRMVGFGSRLYGAAAAAGGLEEYDIHRVRHGVVEPSRDMQSGEDLPLDYGLDRLNAISFSKGCYPGQELTARTHHRDKAKYRIEVRPVTDTGDAPVVAQSGEWAIVKMRREVER